MSPKKTKHQVMSPTPRNPIPRRSSVSRRIIFWGLLTSLGLITVACLLDYQQGKLADHTSRIPYEIQEATKYIINIASDLPHNLEIWSQEARGKLVLLSGKVYVGDKTVAQLVFGEDIQPVDNTPKDIKEDFEIQDLIDPNMKDIEENTLADLKAAEEEATKLRKEEELRLYEANREELKEKAMKIMEKEKQAAIDALMEEKAKLRAKIEAETVLKKSKSAEVSVDLVADEIKDKIAASTETPKAKIASQSSLDLVEDEIKDKIAASTETSKAEIASQASVDLVEDDIKDKIAVSTETPIDEIASQSAELYQKALKNQKLEMESIAAGLNKKMEIVVKQANTNDAQEVRKDEVLIKQASKDLDSLNQDDLNIEEKFEENKKEEETDESFEKDGISEQFEKQHEKDESSKDTSKEDQVHEDKAE